MFENEKLKKVNARLKEVQEKSESLQTEINEIESALAQTFELYVARDIEESDIIAAQNLLKDKKAELAESLEMISKIRVIRKQAAIETIPFVKEARAKKVEALQKKYDSKASEVIEAKNEFLRKMAALGQIAREVGGANSEVNDVLRELGESPETFGAVLNERKTFSPQGFTSEADCLGILENVQKQAYAGNLPQWVGGVK